MGNETLSKIDSYLEQMDEKKKIREAKLSVPDKHQKKIAIDTVKNPMKALLGGPSAEEAEEILRKKFKYSDAQIKKLKGNKTEGYIEALGEGKDEEYKKVFNALAKKHGFDPEDIENLPDDKKKAFFDELDKKWKADKETD